MTTRRPAVVSTTWRHEEHNCPHSCPRIPCAVARLPRTDGQPPSHTTGTNGGSPLTRRVCRLSLPMGHRTSAAGNSAMYKVSLPGYKALRLQSRGACRVRSRQSRVMRTAGCAMSGIAGCCRRCGVSLRTNCLRNHRSRSTGNNCDCVMPYGSSSTCPHRCGAAAEVGEAHLLPP